MRLKFNTIINVERGCKAIRLQGSPPHMFNIAQKQDDLGSPTIFKTFCSVDPFRCLNRPFKASSVEPTRIQSTYIMQMRNTFVWSSWIACLSCVNQPKSHLHYVAPLCVSVKNKYVGFQRTKCVWIVEFTSLHY